MECIPFPWITVKEAQYLALLVIHPVIKHTPAMAVMNIPSRILAENTWRKVFRISRIVWNVMPMGASMRVAVTIDALKAAASQMPTCEAAIFFANANR
jgi:hypothetical protein